MLQYSSVISVFTFLTGDVGVVGVLLEVETGAGTELVELLTGAADLVLSGTEKGR